MRSKITLGSLLLLACLMGFYWAERESKDVPKEHCADGSLCGPTKTSQPAVALTKTAATDPASSPKTTISKSVAKSSGDAMGQFDEWSQNFLKATDEEKARLIEEGVKLAKARRPIFKQLIQGDPRRALMEAVPMVVRQSLPAEIVSELEERVADRGELRVYAAGPESKENGEKAFLRYAETKSGRTFEAYVYGRREFDYRSKPDVHVIGVAMEGDLALSESPLRRLEPGEIPPAGKTQVEVCPVSGKKHGPGDAAAYPSR